MASSSSSTRRGCTVADFGNRHSGKDFFGNSGYRSQRLNERRRRRRRWSARLILIAGVIIAAAGFAAVFWLVRPESSGNVQGQLGANFVENSVVIAVGRDANGAVSHLLAVVPGDRGYSIYTIPARTLVDVPGHGFQQIDRVMDLGGEPLLDQVVESLLKLPVSQHIQFSQEVINMAAEQAGTLSLRAERPLTTADGSVTLAAGDNPVTSSRALAILSASFNDSQSGPLLQALFYQGLRDSLSLRSEQDRRSFAGMLARRVDSDLGSDAFTDVFIELTTAGMTVSVQPLPVRTAGSGASWFFEPLPGQIEALMSRSPGAAISLEVRNGTGQAGITEATAARLAALNFTTTMQAEASGVNYDYTQIRCGSEALAEGEQVRSILGRGTLIKDEYLEKHQIIVIIGRDLGIEGQR